MTDSDIEKVVKYIIDFGLWSNIIKYFLYLSTEHKTKTALYSKHNTDHLVYEDVSEAIVQPKAYYLNWM